MHSGMASRATGALSLTTLGSARSLLKGMKSADGVRLNTEARYLLCSPDSQSLAEQLVATLWPAGAAAADPFASKITVLADANLTGSRFYLIGDVEKVTNFVWGYLANEDGPILTARRGFEVDGIEMKLRVDYGCAPVDTRGCVTCAGQ